MNNPPNLQDFKNRLTRVWKHFSKLARRQDVSCFRFYDHDLPEAPFAIDFLEGVVHASEYRRRHGMNEEAHTAWLKACREIISSVTDVEETHIFMKQRQKKKGRHGQYAKFAETKTERIVKESDLSFILNLTDYLDTGLFLDHRITREMVRKDSAGKRVLNLFCYTGSFTVYSASGNAAHITSVDLSKTYIHWAKRNLQYNKLFKDSQHQFIQADALEWVEEQLPHSFDLIICDPPTFSNSKRMEGDWDVQRDHAALLQDLLYILEPGGSIYFSNNYRNFILDEKDIPASSIQNITGATTPFDFEGRLQRKCYLLTK